MKTIQLTINLEYDDSLIHCGDSNTEAKEWFMNDILRGDTLTLHDGEIGDTIGTVRVTAVGAPDEVQALREKWGIG